jgi:hypothetical protein
MKAKFGFIAALMMIASAVLVAAPAAACHSETVTCDDATWTDNDMSPDNINKDVTARTVWPGASTEYHIVMTLSPGCGGTYYLYTSLSAVPAGWTCTYMDGPGKTGNDISAKDNVQCGSNAVTIHGYVNITAPAQATEGQQAVITAMMGADDNARNDKDCVFFKLTTKVHIPDPPVYVNTPLVNFNMAEDTEDATHINLAGVFKDTDNDPMSYRAKAAGNFTVSVFQDGKVTIKPKKDWNGMEVLVFICTDSITEASDDVAVTVTPVEDLPIVASPMKDFAIAEDGTDISTVNLNKVFFDADTPYGDKLAYTSTGNVNITVTIKVDGKVEFKPLAGWAGQETITFTAKDNALNGVSDDVKVTVTDSSRPPYVKAPLNDFAIAEDGSDSTTINLNSVFADPDVGTTFEYGYDGNAYINVSIAAGLVTFTPKKDWNGYETITFQASDGMFAPVFDDVRVTVTPVNDPPYVKKALEINMAEDTPSDKYYLDNYFGDIDNTKLTYTAESTEDYTITILQKTGEMSLTTKLNWETGNTKIPLTVSDGTDQIVVQVPLVVDCRDDAPMITNWMPGGNAVLTENEELTLTITGMDIDDKDLGVNWEVDQNFTPFKTISKRVMNDARGVETKFTLTVKATKENGLSVGTHTVTAWMDGAEKASVSHAWSVTVRIGNRAPSVPTIRTPVSTQNYTTANTITFDAIAEDLDADPVTYTWYIDGAEKSKTQSFSMKLEAGTHAVKVTASDGKGGITESQILNITVVKPKVKPPENKGLPGFEGLFLIAALGATLILLRKRK